MFACHGSPRQVNEFLGETTTPSHLLAKLAADADCDVIPGRRTGIHRSRRFMRRGHGRPAIYGRTCVWYVALSTDADRLEVEHVPDRYNHEAPALEIAREGIREEFVTTIRTGWCTTSLEILPGRKRTHRRY